MEHGGELNKYYCQHVTNIGDREVYIVHYMTIKNRNISLSQCYECHMNAILRQEE